MKKKSGRMAHRTQQPKFERNPCVRFRENRTTDGQTDERTDDGRSLAELKITHYTVVV